MPLKLGPIGLTEAGLPLVLVLALIWLGGKALGY